MGDLKDLSLDGIKTLVIVLIIFGMIFVLSGSASGFNPADGKFGFGMTLCIIAGVIMFAVSFIRNKLNW